MEERIEIRESDLREPPTTLVPGAGVKPGEGMTPKSVMKSIQDGMKQLKEMKEMAEGLGIDFNNLAGRLGLNLNLPGAKGERKELAETSGPTTAKQVQAFLQLLQMKYGDITLNDTLDRLKDDLGTLKLSQLRGVKL